MRHTVLLVHSAGPQGDHEGSADFVSALRQGLGRGYDVRFPLMPDPDNPKYEPWRRQIERELAGRNRLALVGHSLGGSVLLKYLAESDSDVSILGLFILAAPYWGREGQFDEFVLPENASARLARLRSVFLYHSRDDEEVPFSHLSSYASLLPHARIRELDGYGHLYANGCDELVADITAAIPAIGNHN